MIHDAKRVESIRTRAAELLQLVAALKSQITKGKLELLDVAENQLEDIETFFLASLEKEDRTPSEEAYWLTGAEHMLAVWPAQLQRLNEQFKLYGSKNIQVIGG